MENKNTLKGVLLVAMGASFYGSITIIVKIAYGGGYTASEVTVAEFGVGILVLGMINLITKIRNKDSINLTSKDKIQLILGGTSFGFTSLLYYLSVQYINVSIGIVLLMQTVWLSILVESFLDKKLPSFQKILAVLLILFGTVLATNLLNDEIELNPKGLILGFIAACSFTVTMFSSNRIANHLPPYKKSLWMLIGGVIVVSAFVFFAQIGPYYFESLSNMYKNFSSNTDDIRPFDYSILYIWGLPLGIFSTVLPPILLNKGFPHTGLALGSIISSLELPVSVTAAYFILKEQVLLEQWIGIFIIISAIIMANLKFKIK